VNSEGGYPDDLSVPSFWAHTPLVEIIDILDNEAPDYTLSVRMLPNLIGQPITEVPYCWLRKRLATNGWRIPMHKGWSPLDLHTGNRPIEKDEVD
jgi:hypothetical protein